MLSCLGSVSPDETFCVWGAFWKLSIQNEHAWQLNSSFLRLFSKGAFKERARSCMPFLSLFLPIFSFLFLEWNCYWIHVVVVVVCLLLAPPFSSPTLFGWDEYLLYPRLIAWATAGQQWQMCVLAPTSLELIQPCVCVCVYIKWNWARPCVCVCTLHP